MKKLLLLLVLASGCTAVQAQVMHWTQSGSPYIINGNMNIAANQSLVIDPGVEVVFTGNYRITADGPVKAIGNAERPIIFRSADTTGWSQHETGTGGWAGIQLNAHATHTDSFRNCIIRDIKHNAGSWQMQGGVKTYRNFYMDDCTFYHNKSVANNAAFRIVDITVGTGQTALLENSTFYDNEVQMYLIGNGGDGLKLLRNNKIYNNEGGAMVGAIFCRNLQVLNNEIHHNRCMTVQGHASVLLAANSALISGNLIHHNYSESTAAISSSMGKITIEKNFIYNNTHDSTWVCGYTDGGGALHLSHNNNAPWDSTEYTVRNNVIANNYAPVVGGALYSFDAKIWFMNNTVINNMGKAGGPAIYVRGNRVQLRVKNNIFSGNINTLQTTPMNTESVAVESASVVEFSHNYIDRPLSEAVKTWGGSSLNANSTGNVVAGVNGAGLMAPSSGPGLDIDAVGANFKIKDQSACVNTGDSSAARASATDIAGHIRVVGKIDIGAYETDVKGSGTGIGNLSRNVLQLGITPNPATDQLSLLLPADRGIFSLVNIAGDVVYRTAHNTKVVQLAVSQYPRGIYLLHWQDGRGAAGQSKIILK